MFGNFALKKWDLKKKKKKARQSIILPAFPEAVTREILQASEFDMGAGTVTIHEIKTNR